MSWNRLTLPLLISFLYLAMLSAAGPLFAQPSPETQAGALSIELPEAISRALQSYEKMKISESDVEVARGQEWQGLAYVLPSIGGNYQLTRNLKKPSIFFETGKVEVDFDNVQSWQINIAQPLTRFGGLIQGVKQGKRTREASQFANAQTQADVVFETKQAYYDAMLRRAQMRVAQVSLEAARQIQKREEARFRHGEIPEFDYNRAMLEAENKQAFLLQTQGNYQNAVQTLKRIIGVVPEQEIILTENWEKMIHPYEEKDWVTLFEFYNPEIKALEKTAESKEAGRKVAQSNLFPYFSFFTNYNAVGQSSINFFPSTNEYFNALAVGLNVQIPVFDGMYTWGQYKSAEGNAAKAQWQKVLVEKDLRLALDNALTTARVSWEKEKVQYRSMKLAETLFQQAGVRFHNGILTYIDLKDVENQLEEARLRYIQSLYEYALAAARVEQIIGRPYQNE